MKKILCLGLLTVCALAMSERPAHAWVNSKFSIGLNWHLQSGNNNVLWGAWKNGQVPGPDAYHGGPFQYGPPMSAPGMSQPSGVFPFFGHAPQETAPPPVAQGQTAYYPQQYYPQQYGNYNPYQTVSYQHNPYYYPNYFYPTYQSYAYGYQAPYYWHQGR
jgi:hypothetical protein